MDVILDCTRRLMAMRHAREYIWTPPVHGRRRQNPAGYSTDVSSGAEEVTVATAVAMQEMQGSLYREEGKDNYV